MSTAKDYDVIVLGSGLAGTLTATILARHGHRVAIVERSKHPRFAIGESVLPQASIYLWMLGQHHEIPEIQYLSRLDALTEHVSPRCGLKRSLGFVHHRPGIGHNPNTCNLLVPPPTPATVESHLFREDVDQFMVRSAVRYGAEYFDETETTDIEILESGVRLQCRDGREFRAAFLVDAAGRGSPTAKLLGLRVDPPALKTRTRGMFTHMSGVKLYSDCLAESERLDLSAGWHQGTLHHVFDGGWIWVIPFGNHQHSTSNICSVGASLDLDEFPVQDGEKSGDEFARLVAKFPALARQFAGAKALRPWRSTDRLQYNSKAAVGPRWCLLAHSHGFVDPLFSRGLVSTFESVAALTNRLLPALREADFSVERFAYLDRLLRSSLSSTDRLVHGAQIAFRNYPLWNAWLHVWTYTIVLGDLRMLRAWLGFQSADADEVLAELDDDPAAGTVCPSVPGVQAFVDLAYADLAEVERGTLAAEACARRILKRFDESELTPPGWGWSDEATRHLEFSADTLREVIMWGKMESPPQMRDQLFDFDPSPLMG